MNLHLTGHQLPITPAIREYVANKLQRITHHFDHVIDVNVIMSVEKLQQIAYPIATYTYAIVPSQPKQASLLQQFLNFAITPAEQKKGAPLTFAPLPASVVAVDKTEIGSL